eukprot:c17345_g1_i1.p1 GENE.c17345_g1_i1~~c17345_g1_i1.p1  ORF type:complete len:219 (-),score=75.08 c17345_g1_i1:144-800(-)
MAASKHQSLKSTQVQFIVPSSYKSSYSLKSKSLLKGHCHICRSSKDGLKTVSCTSGKKNHIFCRTCVEKKLQISFVQVKNDTNWICPKCQNCCPCSRCTKQEETTPNSFSDKKRSTTELSLLTLNHSCTFSFSHQRHIPVPESPSLIFSKLTIHSPKPISSPKLHPLQVQNIDSIEQIQPLFLPPPLTFPTSEHSLLEITHNQQLQLQKLNEFRLPDS